MSKQISSGSDEWHDASEGIAPPPSASEIAKMQEVLSQAAAQQQAALAEGSSHLKQLAVELQTQAAAQAETQAAEWRAAAGGVVVEQALVDQLQAQPRRRRRRQGAPRGRAEGEGEGDAPPRRLARAAAAARRAAARAVGAARRRARARLRAAHAALRTMRRDLETLRGAASEALRDGAVAAAGRGGRRRRSVGARESRDRTERGAARGVQQIARGPRCHPRALPLPPALRRRGRRRRVLGRRPPSHGGISVSSDPISAYNSAPLDFKFDATFGATASTRQVYEELSPAVASVLQVNATVQCQHHHMPRPHHTLHLHSPPPSPPRCCRVSTSA